jgi:glutamate/tyrosine decarboxylase-like PLP-dependent enzyme
VLHVENRNLPWAGFAGSRSGALIATAWAAMVHQGQDGYLRITDAMLKARHAPCPH